MVFAILQFLKRLVRWTSHQFSVITVTLALHGIIGGAVVFILEVLVVGINLDDWVGIRLLYNIALFAGGKYCQQLTDYLRLKFRSNSTHPFRRALADTLALASYKIPLFALSAAIFQLEVGKIIGACLLDFVEIAGTGWLYGVILNWVRKIHNEPYVKP